jgi:hypothetical protein
VGVDAAADAVDAARAAARDADAPNLEVRVDDV